MADTLVIILINILSFVNKNRPFEEFGTTGNYYLNSTRDIVVNTFKGCSLSHNKNIFSSKLLNTVYTS